MRSAHIVFSLLIGVAVGLPVLVDSSTAAADVKPTAGSPKALVSGAYFLLLHPKQANGATLRTQTKVLAWPVVLKTDGSTVVMGGKHGAQMTGSIGNGAVNFTHAPGKTFTLTGTTFNGYAASGTFSMGTPGQVVTGTWGLVTFSKGGLNFVGSSRAPGVLGNNRTGVGSTSGFGSSLPGGVSGSWGYDGPGFTGGGLTGPNMGTYGANAKGKGLQNWADTPAGGGGSSGLSTGSKETPSNSGGGGLVDSIERAYDDFVGVGKKDDTGSKGGSSSGGSSGGSSSSGFVDSVGKAASAAADSVLDAAEAACQWVGACAPPAGGSSSSSSSGSSGAGGSGGFEAGDWEPAGGDTSPGKPNTGNGQDQGSGGSGGGVLRTPMGAGDPASDWFGRNSGDILNTNKLFNGAADPPRVGTTFIRPSIVR